MGVVALVDLGGPRGRRKPKIPPGPVVPNRVEEAKGGRDRMRPDETETECRE